MKLVIANTLIDEEFNTQQELDKKIEDFGIVPEDNAVIIQMPQGVIIVIKRTVN